MRTALKQKTPSCKFLVPVPTGQAKAKPPKKGLSSSETEIAVFRTQLRVTDKAQDQKVFRETSKAPSYGSGRANVRNVGIKRVSDAWDEYGSTIDESHPKVVRDKSRKTGSSEKGKTMIGIPFSTLRLNQATSSRRKNEYEGIQTTNREVPPEPLKKARISSQTTKKAHGSTSSVGIKKVVRQLEETEVKLFPKTNLSPIYFRQKDFYNEPKVDLHVPDTKRSTGISTKRAQSAVKKTKTTSVAQPVKEAQLALLKSNVPVKKKSTKKIFVKSAVKIQRWWRKVLLLRQLDRLEKKRKEKERLKELEREREREKEREKEREREREKEKEREREREREKEREREREARLSREHCSPAKPCPSVTAPAVPEPSKSKDLRSILDRCRELSKAQSQQWAELIGYIHQLDVSSGKAPLARRIHQESTRAIQQLSRFNGIRCGGSQNKSHSVTSFSMERKAIERWLQPDESVASKNGYELLHGSVFNGSKSNRALLAPKKLNISAKNSDHTESLNLLRFLKIETPSANFPPVESTEDKPFEPEPQPKVPPSPPIEDPLERPSEQRRRRQDSESLAKLILNELVENVLAVNPKAGPEPTTCSISEDQLHLLLNDLSEILLFTKLPSLRTLLSLPKNSSLIYSSRETPQLLPNDKESLQKEVSITSQEGPHPLVFLFSQGLLEALNSLRPMPKPLILLSPPYPLLSEHSAINQLENACNILLNWTDVMAGFLLTGENCYIERIREERMNKMIETEVRESQRLWACTADQELRVSEEIDEWIFNLALDSVLADF